MQTVRELPNGRLVLRAGTLYAALDRLTTDGLVGVTGRRPSTFLPVLEVGSGRWGGLNRLIDATAAVIAVPAMTKTTMTPATPPRGRSRR
jgi:hypothetical protein